MRGDPYTSQSSIKLRISWLNQKEIRTKTTNYFAILRDVVQPLQTLPYSPINK